MITNDQIKEMADRACGSYDAESALQYAKAAAQLANAKATQAMIEKVN